MKPYAKMTRKQREVYRTALALIQDAYIRMQAVKINKALQKKKPSK